GSVKTAQGFHVYLAPGFQNAEVTAVLGELGLEVRLFEDAANMVQPALVVVGPGQQAPEGLADITFAAPADAPRSTIRELLRMAMENVALRQEVKQLEEQARRQHRQFEELNRIGISLSAERDIGKLQEFILTTM